ncbi:MAG: hypothetical protein ACP5N2_01225 [Candidatus Nanoarchaeia archaeon]
MITKKQNQKENKKENKYFNNCNSNLCKNKFKLLAILFLFLLNVFLFSNSVQGLGVLPAFEETILEGSSIKYDITIVNEENIDQELSVLVEGDLAEYIRLSESVISFSKGEPRKTITATLTVPQRLTFRPGEYNNRVVIKQQSKEEGMIAKLGVASRWIITVPGEGASLTVNLFSPNFIKNSQNSFSVEVFNKGNKQASNCKALIDVYTALNVKVDSFVSTSRNIAPKTQDRIQIYWTPNVENGNYFAKASVICDDADGYGEKSFSVGSPDLEIESFATDNFKLGEISKFDLILSSSWGEQIDGVHADVELAKGDLSIFKIGTESKNIGPLKSISIPVFMDTAGVAPGDYTIFITLYYLGKQKEEVYSAKLLEDRAVITSLTGNVVGGRASDSSGAGDKSGDSYMGLLILAIVIVVIVNVVLVIKFMRKKK